MTQKISPEVLASAPRMASAMRSLSGCEIMSHQLPDEPPPPNEPPPPEKPPPSPEKPPPENPPPEKPPEEPDHQGDEDDHGLRLSRRRLFGEAGIAPTILMKTNQNTPNAKIRISIVPHGVAG